MISRKKGGKMCMRVNQLMQRVVAVKILLQKLYQKMEFDTIKVKQEGNDFLIAVSKDGMLSRWKSVNGVSIDDMIEYLNGLRKMGFKIEWLKTNGG